MQQNHGVVRAKFVSHAGRAPALIAIPRESHDDAGEALEATLKPKQATLPDTEAAPARNEPELTEERMRRALGLGGPSIREPPNLKAGTERVASNTEKPGSSAHRGSSRAQAFTVGSDALAPLHQRVAELEGQLAAERQHHDEVRRLLQRTELTVRTLETRSQHETLTRQEELDAERRATMRAQRALDESLFEMQQRENARSPAKVTVPVASGPARSQATDDAPKPLSSAPKLTALAVEPTPSRKRGRPRTKPLPEPKPVRWWTPSYRAEAKAKK